MILLLCPTKHYRYTLFFCYYYFFIRLLLYFCLFLVCWSFVEKTSVKQSMKRKVRSNLAHQVADQLADLTPIK